jgi:hypothetical protein
MNEAKNDVDHAIADFDQPLKLDPSLAGERWRGTNAWRSI